MASKLLLVSLTASALEWTNDKVSERAPVTAEKYKMVFCFFFYQLQPRVKCGRRELWP